MILTFRTMVKMMMTLAQVTLMVCRLHITQKAVNN